MGGKTVVHTPSSSWLERQAGQASKASKIKVPFCSTSPLISNWYSFGQISTFSIKTTQLQCSLGQWSVIAAFS